MSLSLLRGDVVQDGPERARARPLLGAAKRTLAGEDHSAKLEGERKARRRTNERWGKKMAPSLGPPTPKSHPGEAGLFTAEFEAITVEVVQVFG